MDEDTKKKILEMEIPTDIKKIDPSTYLKEPELPVQNISEINIDHDGEKICIKGVLRRITQPQPSLKLIGYHCDICNQMCVHKTKDNKCATCGYYLKRKTTKKMVLWTLFFDNNLSSDKECKIKVCFNTDIEKTFNELTTGTSYTIEGTLRIGTTKNYGKDDVSYFYLEAESYKPLLNILDSANLTNKDKENNKRIANDPDRDKKMINTIFGNYLINMEIPMESAILALFGAPKVYLDDNKDKVLLDRGNLMILFTGSPGTAKTSTFKHIEGFYPKVESLPCTTTSSVGITAVVERDKLLGGWFVSPGVIPQLHPGGVCLLDEFDKINKDDMSRINTMMDSLVIRIVKAGSKIFPADVSLLIAMNPENRYYDYSSPKTLFEQLNLPQDLIDRFDLVFNMDHYSPDNKKAISGILSIYKNATDDDQHIEKYSKEELIKYIIEARSINPKISTACLNRIEDIYNELLGKRADEKTKSKRFAQRLVRLSRAYARKRLSSEVLEQDILDAKHIFIESFISMDVIRNIGGQLTINEELIVNRKPMSDNAMGKAIKDKISELQRKKICESNGLVEIEALKEEIENDNKDRTTDNFDRILEKLLTDGTLIQKGSKVNFI